MRTLHEDDRHDHPRTLLKQHWRSKRNGELGPEARGVLHRSSLAVLLLLSRTRGCRKARCCQPAAYTTEIPMLVQLFTGPVGSLLRSVPIGDHNPQICVFANARKKQFQPDFSAGDSANKFARLLES